MEFAVREMGPLLRKLDEVLLDEYNLKEKVKKDVRSLATELTMMQAVLLKVGDVPRDHLDPEVEFWARKVRELSSKMEDAVDAFMVHVEESSDGETSTVKKFVKKSRRLFRTRKYRHLISDAIEEAQDRIKQLREQRERYGFGMQHVSATFTIDPRIWALYKDVTVLVGIDSQRDELVEMLTGGEELKKRKTKTVSIVGFGGLGKTTLAKAVYEKIKVNFDCVAFVSVSQSPDMKIVFKDILSCLVGFYDTVMDEKQPLDELNKFLNNKRYLIVIDDIWDEDLWKIIKRGLSENSLGSRVITTTRNVNVAKACSSSSSEDIIYTMKPLSDDDSQRLFRRIFESETACPHELEQVSMGILKKCGGVPLAIITIASILASNLRFTQMDQWDALLNSIGRGVLEGDCPDNRLEDTRRILSFSYYDMPSYLKTCLLYLSTFTGTGSHVFERYRLVKKWIAEGIVSQETKLIQSSHKKEAKVSQQLSLEEEASQYLDELVNRNVIQPLECNDDCEPVSYHIHPMMHDVLRFIAREEKFAASLDYEDISSENCREFRHLFIDIPNSENPSGSANMGFDNVVRSLTVFGCPNRFLLLQFKGTRVLDLEGCKSIESSDLEHICSMVLLKWLCLSKTQITELPPQIGNLKHLEGLDVGGTQITQLPPQIGKLQRLKTLDARKSGVKDLPDQVVRLTELIHLLIGDSESNEGVKLPDGIGKMTSLQRVCTIDLRKCLASSLVELGELPRLKEIEVISSDEPEVTRMNNVLVSSLDKSTNLKSLVVYGDFKLSTKLQSSSLYKYVIFRMKLIVVRSLKVPISIAGQHFLRMLDIRVCKLEEDDLKILREMPRLQNLIVRLEVLPRTTVRITCEGFGKLESFYVDCRMPRVIFEKGAMPNLGHLELKLYAGSASKEQLGIKHLRKLEKVSLWYSKCYATNNGVKETTDAVKVEAKEHWDDINPCIPEEDKEGTMKIEICPKNKEASCSRMTEIEEGHADGSGNATQEGDVHQSSFDIASSSGTNEIEEVVE